MTDNDDKTSPSAGEKPRVEMCTGCGVVLDANMMVDGGHADTYSGTVWHCPDCATVCAEV